MRNSSEKYCGVNKKTYLLLFLVNDQRDAQIVFSLLPTCTHFGHQHRMTVTRGYIDTICLSWWWARRARNMQRVINRNKYIEKNLCVTLVNYQESLHDARSTKCNIPSMLNIGFRKSCRLWDNVEKYCTAG